MRCSMMRADGQRYGQDDRASTHAATARRSRAFAISDADFRFDARARRPAFQGRRACRASAMPAAAQRGLAALAYRGFTSRQTITARRQFPRARHGADTLLLARAPHGRLVVILLII